MSTEDSFSEQIIAVIGPLHAKMRPPRIGERSSSQAPSKGGRFTDGGRFTSPRVVLKFLQVCAQARKAKCLRAALDNAQVSYRSYWLLWRGCRPSGMVMTPWDELRTLDRKSKRPVLNILSAAVTFQVKSSTVDVTVSDIPVNAVTRGINNIIDLMSLIVIEDLAGNAWLDSDTDTLIFGKNKYPKISTPRGFKRFIKSLDGRQFLT